MNLENEDVQPDSSTGTDVNPDSSTDEDQGVIAGSPDADGEKGTLLDAVTAALEPTSEESPPSAEPGEGEEPDTGEATADTDGDELSEEELKGFSDNAQRRIRSLAGENKTLKSDLETAQEKAGRFDRFQAFINQYQLAPAQLNEALQTAAAIRSDPDKALSLLAPIVNELLDKTGRRLPADLQEQVRQGYVTREAAAETARLRAQNAAARQRESARTQQDQQTQARAAYEKAEQAMTSAADAWHEKVSASDPDFAMKQDEVLEIVKGEAASVFMRERRPLTPKEVVDIADAAHKRVTERFKARQPRPTSKRNVQATGPASGQGQPEPKDAREAVTRALGF